MNAPMSNGPSQSRSGRMPPPRIDASFASMDKWSNHLCLRYANPAKIIIILKVLRNQACRVIRAVSLQPQHPTAANPLFVCHREAQQRPCRVELRPQIFLYLKTAPFLYSQPQSRGAPHPRHPRRSSNHLKLLDHKVMETE